MFPLTTTMYQTYCMCCEMSEVMLLLNWSFINSLHSVLLMEITTSKLESVASVCIQRWNWHIQIDPRQTSVTRKPCESPDSHVIYEKTEFELDWREAEKILQKVLFERSPWTTPVVLQLNRTGDQ